MTTPPRVHATMLEGAPNLSGICLLARFLAEDFVTSHGTSLATPLPLNSLAVCELYYKILERRLAEEAPISSCSNGFRLLLDVGADLR